jgi:hypothetical protein
VAIALVMGAATLACRPGSGGDDGSSSSGFSWGFGGRRGPAYELDQVERAVPPAGAEPTCPKEDLVPYKGEVLRYERPATVHRALPERLARFEAIARDVGVEIYGRPPSVVHHAGAFACRTTQSGRYLSEHALGNALDVEGFSFGPMPKAERAALASQGRPLPPRAEGGLRIRVHDAWQPDGPEHAKRFFALLLERLRARDDIFRAIIGPPDPSHPRHLHLDVGLWSYSRYEPPTASGGG